MADPDSHVDVIYVPANQDVSNAPFELTLFDDVESAEKEERLPAKRIVGRCKCDRLIDRRRSAGGPTGARGSITTPT